MIADELAVALRAAGKDTDRYRRVQRRQRLTMAAELQWELLPGRSLAASGSGWPGRSNPRTRCTATTTTGR